MSALAFSWFAFALTLAALAAAFAALTARSLFALAMHVAAFGAIVAAALLNLGAGEAALGGALVVVVWTPLLLLGGMLLSARAAKQLGKGAPWGSIFAASLAAGAVLIAVPDLGEPAAPLQPASPSAIGPWLAPLIVVTAAACVALLGFGERGALRRPEHDL